MDAEVTDLLAGDPMDWPQPDNSVMPSLPGLSPPSYLYKSPLPPVDEKVSKYDVESDWMDSESDEMDQSPSPRVSCSSPPLSAFRPVQLQAMCATGPATSPVSPRVLRVEGQPSCDGQDLHAPCCKSVEGHSQANRELDLRDHPHPQKYARTIAPSVATFEFTDVWSREPYVFDQTPTPKQLHHGDPIVRNEWVPRQPMPKTPFCPEACAPNLRGYANVTRKPSIHVSTTGAPVKPSWVWKPIGTPKIPALMSMEIQPPTKNTQFGGKSTHENYMWMLQHAREQGRPRREDRYNILAGIHKAPLNHPVRQISWEAHRKNSGQAPPTTHYQPG